MLALVRGGRGVCQHGNIVGQFCSLCLQATQHRLRDSKHLNHLFKCMIGVDVVPARRHDPSSSPSYVAYCVHKAVRSRLCHSLQRYIMNRLSQANLSRAQYAQDASVDSERSYETFPSTTAELSNSSSNRSLWFEMAANTPARTPARTPMRAPVTSPATTPAVAPAGAQAGEPNAPLAGEAGREDPHRQAALEAAREIARETAIECVSTLLRRRGGVALTPSVRTSELNADLVEREACPGFPSRPKRPRRRKPSRAKGTMYWIRPRDGKRPGAWGGIKDALSGQGPDVFVVGGDSRPWRRDCPSVGNWSGWKLDYLEEDSDGEAWETLHDRKVHFEMPWAKRNRGQKYNFWEREFEDSDERQRSGYAGRLMDQNLWYQVMQQMQQLRV